MYKGDRSFILFLNDIIEALEKIETYIKDMSYEEFIKDDKTKDAVLRNLEVIGEAAKNLSIIVKEKYPAVKWKAIMGMRDKIIHEYFGVSFSIVWETIQNDLPPFKYEVKRILNDLEKDAIQ